jgi:hypothetical protein
MKKLTNERLRLCILALNAAHVVASRLLIMHIGHIAKVKGIGVARRN